MSNYEFWNELDKIFEAVLAYQKKNIEFNKAFISPWVRLGHVFPREDSSQKDLQAILHEAELDPENVENWANIGDAFYKTGNLEEAVKAYGKAIELDPTAAWPKSNLALTLATQGKFQEAILMYKESLDKFTNHREKAVTWNRLGDVYRKLGDFEHAVAAFLRADELDTKISIYPDLMIESLEPNSMDEPAQEMTDSMENHVTHNPNFTTNELAAKAQEKPEDKLSFSSSSWFNLTNQSEFVAKVFDSEISMFPGKDRETATLNATNPESEQTVIKTYPNQDISEGGIAHPDTSGVNPSEILPQDSISNPKTIDEVVPDSFGFMPSTEPVNLEVVTDINSEKIDSSRTELPPFDLMEQSRNKEPATNKQQDNKIAYEEYLKDFVEPTRINREPLTEQSSKPQPVSETPESDDTKTKMQFDTQNADVWNEMGNVYFSSGVYDKAILAYSQAIELDPQFAWAYSNLALTFVQKERFEEAILLYERSIELFKNAKDKATTWNRLGNLYRRQQDYDNAILAYQTADEFDPDSIALSLRSRFSLLGNLEEQPAYSL